MDLKHCSYLWWTAVPFQQTPLLRRLRISPGSSLSVETVTVLLPHTRHVCGIFFAAVSNRINIIFYGAHSQQNWILVNHEELLSNTLIIVSYQKIFCLAAILVAISWNRLCWYYLSRFCSMKVKKSPDTALRPLGSLEKAQLCQFSWVEAIYRHFLWSV